MENFENYQIDPETGQPIIDYSLFVPRGMMGGGDNGSVAQFQRPRLAGEGNTTVAQQPQNYVERMDVQRPAANTGQSGLGPQFTPEMRQAAGQNWAEQKAGLMQQDRFGGAIADAAGGYLKKGLLGAGVSALADVPFDPMSVVTPSSLLGNVANAVYDDMGLENKGFSFSDPSWEGAINSLIQKGAPIAGGLMGGPAGALAGKTLATPFANMVTDAFDVRSNEELRDGLEDSSGEMRGRRQFADATQGIGPLSQLQGAPSFHEAQLAAQQAFYNARTDEEKTSALQQMQAYKNLSDVMKFNSLKQNVAPSDLERQAALVQQGAWINPDTRRVYNPTGGGSLSGNGSAGTIDTTPYSGGGNFNDGFGGYGSGTMVA